MQRGSMALRSTAAAFDVASEDSLRISCYERFWMLKAAVGEPAKDRSLAQQAADVSPRQSGGPPPLPTAGGTSSLPPRRGHIEGLAVAHTKLDALREALTTWQVDTDEIDEVVRFYSLHLEGEFNQASNHFRLVLKKLAGMPRLARLVFVYADMQRGQVY